ncbi:DUF2231 domain-containing protein [Lujinxingia vulgaris]|nr:DUF2231 domain-containing protein [Lujinxingia vulgaris]
MATRLHVLHPMLVHMPLALMPVAIGADVLGKFTGQRGLCELGRRAMGLTAVGGVLSSVSGLVAQEAVHLEGEEARAKLVTHRNLNLGITAAALVMVGWRRRMKEPSPGYLLSGFGGLAGLFYTAWLGGELVYRHGAGVERAGGVREEKSPELLPKNARRVVGTGAANVREGAKHVVEELKDGEVAPQLRFNPPMPPS